MCGLGLLGNPVRADSGPGPAPQYRPAESNVEATNHACESCHPEIAQEWRASFHRQSYTDPAFQRSLVGERQPFCRSCHAPEAEPVIPPVGWAATAGVACVTCHLPSDALPVAGSAHPLLRPRTTELAAACERCHEFQFPDGDARTQPEWMQRTVSEHQASPQQAISCAECHMPLVGRDGHRSHRFTAGHDPATLRSALTVQATRRGTTLQLRLVPVTVGHALPTGDLFRRLRITAEARTADGDLLARQQRVLARSFEQRRVFGEHAVKIEVADSRLGGPSEVTFDLGPRAATIPLYWQVRYQRIISPRRGPSAGPLLDGEVVVAEGVIP